VASGNYTVGEIGDLVRHAVEERLGTRVNLNIKHIEDFRNYKVSTDKASNVLSFHPSGNVAAIVGSLADNLDKISNLDDPMFSNIQTFKKLDSEIDMHSMAGASA
jgi:hypothetical protein